MDVYPKDLTRKAAEYAIRNYRSHRKVPHSTPADSYVSEASVWSSRYNIYD